jgi:pimeloyl-ACP methyl ester carboxylesterase
MMPRHDLIFGFHRRSRRPAVLALILFLVFGLAACTFPTSGNGSGGKTSQLPTGATAPAGVTDPATDPALATYYEQKVDWTDCDGEFQCAKVRMPLDWDKPAEKSIEIAIIRLPAGGDKLGSLLVNPGGPGVSGINYAKYARQAFGEALLRNYDIVGFDPRGVGASDPISCLPDSQLDAYVAADTTPDDPTELAGSVSDLKRFAEACEQNTGPLLGKVDTLSTVRDLDVLRSVLGDDVLSYQGASYGTYIGAWYAQTFPWRVGRMVLDGAVDPSLTSKQYVAGQAEGFSRALKAYVEDCQSRSDCPLRGSLQDGLDQIGTLVERADASPVKTEDPQRPLTQSLMITGIAQALYASQLWPQLTKGITNALAGNGKELLALADLYLERDAKGHFGQTISANPAIFCLDVPEKRTAAQIGADAAELQRKFPPLGGAIGWAALTCSQWPIKSVMPRQKVTAEGAAPILVLGTVDDPATPYEWAQGLSSQLSSARLLTWEGTVHTAYNQGSDCIDDKVESYLLTGAVPAEGTRCK